MGQVGATLALRRRAVKQTAGLGAFSACTCPRLRGSRSSEAGRPPSEVVSRGAALGTLPAACSTPVAAPRVRRARSGLRDGPVPACFGDGRGLAHALRFSLVHHPTGQSRVASRLLPGPATERASSPLASRLTRSAREPGCGKAVQEGRATGEAELHGQGIRGLRRTLRGFRLRGWSGLLRQDRDTLEDQRGWRE